MIQLRRSIAGLVASLYPSLVVASIIFGSVVLGLWVTACKTEPSVQVSERSSSEDRAELNLFRGRNALSLERYDLARRYFSLDLETHPRRFESLHGLAMTWRRGPEGSLSQAIEAYERALDVERRPQLLLELAESLLRYGEAEAALEHLAALAELDPTVIGADVLQARALTDRDPDGARAAIERALERSPDLYEVQLQAAKIAERRGDLVIALRHVQRARNIEPLAPAPAFLEAQLLRRTGDPAAAEHTLEVYEVLDALAASTTSASNHSGQHRIKLLRRAVEGLGLSFREPRANQGDVSEPSLRQRHHHAVDRVVAQQLLNDGRVDEARPSIDALIADPHTPASLLFDLGQKAHAHARIGPATTLYGAALERQPQHLGALAERAMLAFDVGDVETCRKLVDQLEEIDDTYAPLHHVRGLLALSDDDLPSAILALEQAVDLAPWMRRFRKTLIDTLLAAGDPERARQVKEAGEAEADEVSR